MVCFVQVMVSANVTLIELTMVSPTMIMTNLAEMDQGWIKRSRESGLTVGWGLPICAITYAIVVRQHTKIKEP